MEILQDIFSGLITNAIWVLGGIFLFSLLKKIKKQLKGFFAAFKKVKFVPSNEQVTFLKKSFFLAPQVLVKKKAINVKNLCDSAASKLIILSN